MNQPCVGARNHTQCCVEVKRAQGGYEGHDCAMAVASNCREIGE